jgi:hypothetical protein
LPFVLTKKPCGGSAVLDVRRVRLARLDGQYARKAWKACGARRKGKRRRKSK